MKDAIRRDLEKLCHSILANDDKSSLADQLTQVQMLYERMLVLNYLEEKEQAEREKISAPPAPAARPQSAASPPPPTASAESVSGPGAEQRPEPPVDRPEAAPESTEKAQPQETAPKPPSRESEMEAEARPQRQNSLNDRLARGTIEVGLNDRLAFVKHLFGGQQEDFNRVLSQLNTAGSYGEAADFVQNLVKPEYDWTDKEEYEERLMELIRQKFGEEND